jgi:hypothetical protein
MAKPSVEARLAAGQVCVNRLRALYQHNTVEGIAMDRSSAVSTGIGFGSALAITISWSLHKSLVWAIVHGFFGWFYVAYYALTR